MQEQKMEFLALRSMLVDRPRAPLFVAASLAAAVLLMPIVGRVARAQGKGFKHSHHRSIQQSRH